LKGNEADSFKKFPALIDLWQTTDSENYRTLSTMDNRFQCYFIVLAVTQAIFEACHPFIALDGCYIKSKFQMILLVASMIDSNNEILLIAWAIVSIEDTENWTWFLEHIEKCFYEIGNEGMVIISDKDKGLVMAISKVFPLAYHSYYS
jgi:MULE transposase domain